MLNIFQTLDENKDGTISFLEYQKHINSIVSFIFGPLQLMIR